VTRSREEHRALTLAHARGRPRTSRILSIASRCDVLHRARMHRTHRRLSGAPCQPPGKSSEYCTDRPAVAPRPARALPTRPQRRAPAGPATGGRNESARRCGTRAARSRSADNGRPRRRYGHSSCPSRSAKRYPYVHGEEVRVPSLSSDGSPRHHRRHPRRAARATTGRAAHSGLKEPALESALLRESASRVAREGIFARPECGAGLSALREPSGGFIEVFAAPRAETWFAARTELPLDTWPLSYVDEPSGSHARRVLGPPDKTRGLEHPRRDGIDASPAARVAENRVGAATGTSARLSRYPNSTIVRTRSASLRGMWARSLSRRSREGRHQAGGTSFGSDEEIVISPYRSIS